jgi:hypothetical protein
VGSRGRLARVRDAVTTPAGSLALIILAAVVAVAAVPFWILHDAGATDASEAFVSTPQFVLWVLILCAQTAVWVGAAAFVVTTVIRRVRTLRPLGALSTGAVAAIVVAGVGIAVVIAVLLFGSRLGLFPEFAQPQGLPTGSDWPLQGHETKMLPLVGTALVIGLLAIAGIWLTALGFAQASSVESFIELRSEMTTLLAVAAVLIGIATLASGALREAVLAENSLPVYREAALGCLADSSGESATAVRSRFRELGESFPDCLEWQFDRRFVLAYGLLFSGVLGLAFAPSFLVMRRAGERLRDDSYPLPEPKAGDFFAVVEKRRSFDALLQTNLSGMVAFKAAAAIATPLAASLVSTLVPT